MDLCEQGQKTVVCSCNCMHWDWDNNTVPLCKKHDAPAKFIKWEIFSLKLKVNDNCQSMFVIITSTSLKSVVNRKVG